MTPEQLEAIRQQVRLGCGKLALYEACDALLTALDEQAAELARLRRVEQAARAYRDEHDCTFQCETADALRAALDGGDRG